MFLSSVRSSKQPTKCRCSPWWMNMAVVSAWYAKPTSLDWSNRTKCIAPLPRFPSRLEASFLPWLSSSGQARGKVNGRTAHLLRLTRPSGRGCASLSMRTKCLNPLGRNVPVLPLSNLDGFGTTYLRVCRCPPTLLVRRSGAKHARDRLGQRFCPSLFFFGHFSRPVIPAYPEFLGEQWFSCGLRKYSKGRIEKITDITDNFLLLRKPLMSHASVPNLHIRCGAGWRQS